MSNRLVALAWFRREDYAEIRRLCVDDLDPTFEGWQARITLRLQALEAAGVKVEKVIILPGELQGWAREQGLRIDSQARASLAAMLLARRSMN
jgi:hypothetical protein